MTLQYIYERLGLADSTGCLIKLSDSSWEDKVSFPSRILRLLKKNELLSTLDAFFCFDNKPLILFFNNPADKKSLHQTIWNFNESPIAIIVENDAVEIFNGFAIDDNTKLLKSLGGVERLDDFTYFELVTGKTWEKYHNEISHRNRVDFRLLNNIEVAQKLLREQGLSQATANALLGKIIFIRYLIDRHVRLNYQEKEFWTNSDLCECLSSVDKFVSFIQHIESRDTGFDGEVFCISEAEFSTINQSALDILIRLLQSEELSTGQKSLFDMYDFAILPIEFISNVYEKFIGVEKQDEEGAYYTPTFLVDYIVSETIGKKLRETDGYDCKVLDPACGSGIFLVESLRRMIEKYIYINNIVNTNTVEFHDALRKITKDNIFGIDKDYSAIQVAIFSVYLTLLDYQSPADIENFKFPKLLGENFIYADTFDSNNNELCELKNKHVFDYIIGNPPWKRGYHDSKNMQRNSRVFCEQYLSSANLAGIVGNKELAQAFVLRSLDFAAINTTFAFVLTSKVLYNVQSQGFRKYMLEKMYIDQVFELASVRKEVFYSKKATSPACIMIYKKANGENTDCHAIQHIALKPSRFFRLFKVFSLSRHDIQYVQQKLLKDYDWLWKTLVYGSYLDFNFIRRLKLMNSIADELERKHALIKQGLKRKDKDREIDVTSLLGWDFMDLTKEIQQCYISKSHSKWNLPKVGYIYRNKTTKEIDVRIYTAPMLLVKECVNPQFESVSAVSDQNLLFTDKVTSIKFEDRACEKYYYSLCGILNSSLFAYYIMQSSSTTGIMIEQQVNDEERFSFPFLHSEFIVENVKKMEELCAKEYSEIYKCQDDIDRIKSEIDLHICELLKMSSVEKDLWRYTRDIIIPMLGNKENKWTKIDENDSEGLLRDYAQVYIARFSESFNKIGQHFIVEVIYSDQIIGMYFKVVDEQTFANEFILSKRTDVLFTIIKLFPSRRITDELFVQKDIRGFEKDYFYIFKPNEKRLWHKAIAHLDVNEFADAMLKVGGVANG